MDNFMYYTPTRVLFGRGQEEKTGRLIKEAGGTKVLLHYGGHSAEKSGLLGRVRDMLNKEGISFVELGGVRPNPELPLVRKGIELCLKEKVDFVLAVGGGSVIDSSKAIANGAANPDKDVWQFSLKKETVAKTLPKGVILTLAAAGSEMSASCVITNPDTKEKRGFLSEYNRPVFAIENPELTYSVGRFQTGCGAVDIAMHTMERYFSRGGDTYLTDSIAEALLRSIIKAGKTAVFEPANYDARANMMWASSLSHNDLTGCGREGGLLVHQFEHEISGLHPEIAHGAGLSAIWCSWARYSYRACPERFVQFAVNVWGVNQDFEHPEATALEGIDRQEKYYREIGMPTSLRELGIKEEELTVLADMCSFNKTRTLDWYRPFGYDDMLEIFKMAYYNE